MGKCSEALVLTLKISKSVVGNPEVFSQKNDTIPSGEVPSLMLQTSV